MPVKINASTSSGLVVDSDLTGSLQLQTNGNPAISIDSSQVANFAKQFQIGGVLPPAFSAFTSGTQTVTNNTQTLLTYSTERFDTNNNFNSSTFTPTVAGYYQVNVMVQWHGSTYSGLLSVFLRLNGSNFVEDAWYPTQYTYGKISQVIYMNGTTDNINVYVIQASGSSAPFAAANFSAALIRSA
jgi:hypothetical protein